MITALPLYSQCILSISRQKGNFREHWCRAPWAGFEPGTFGSEVQHSTTALHPAPCELDVTSRVRVTCASRWHSRINSYGILALFNLIHTYIWLLLKQVWIPPLFYVLYRNISFESKELFIYDAWTVTSLLNRSSTLCIHERDLNTDWADSGETLL